MSRFDQCTKTCTTDCGHCKGRPVEALRATVERFREELAFMRAYAARLTDERDAARLHYGEALTDRVELEGRLAQQEPVIEAAKAYTAKHGDFLRALADEGDSERIRLVAAVDALEPR